MTTEQATIWLCNYCLKTENQGGARAMALPPIPPPGWIRVMVSRFKEIPGAEGHKKSEVLQNVQRDACPACAPEVEKAVLR